MIRMLQWGLYILLVGTGTLGFLALCGDETPGCPAGLRTFLETKLIAGGMLWLSVTAWRYLDRRGMLPKFNELNDPEEDDGWED